MAQIIKPLNRDNLEAVIAIDRSFTGVSRRGFFEKRLTAAMNQPKNYVYVAMHENDRLVGYALAKLESGEFGQPGAKASFDAIGVERDYRGRGTGSKLLKATEDILVHKKVTHLTSHVDWADHSMLAFFSNSGFCLAPRKILMRDTSTFSHTNQLNMDELSEPLEIDHSAPEGDEPAALSQDRILVRSMEQSDLDAIIRIDQKITGTNRSTYYQRKQDEALHRSGIRVSVIAQLEGIVAGFIMGRVDFGEFGRTSSEAVMDAIGVDPDYRGLGIGHELMAKIIANLAILRVDNIRTEISWNDVGLIAYLDDAGFVPAQTLVVTRNLSK